MSGGETRTPEETQALYDRVLATVASARASLAEGRAVELGMLDQEVAKLCARVASLPAGEARGYIDKLKILYQAADALGAAMQREQIALGREMKGVPLHQKANSAYQAAGQMPGAQQPSAAPVASVTSGTYPAPGTFPQEEKHPPQGQAPQGQAPQRENPTPQNGRKE